MATKADYGEDGRVVCQVCGESFISLTKHLSGCSGDPPHADTGIEDVQDYRAAFPDAPTSPRTETGNGEEYDEYTSTGRPICQVCGDDFEILVSHVRDKHGYGDLDEYRDEFDDPPVYAKDWGMDKREVKSALTILSETSFDDIADWELQEIEFMLGLLDEIDSQANELQRELTDQVTETLN